MLRGSANYVWWTTSVLGTGATGTVYKGVSKINGESVAVKTFNQNSQMRPHEVQMREFEVLKKVKHKNIVKLLSIEQVSYSKIIVMELCTGGSLFDVLKDPENAYGLEENEFLLVLDHLSAGMKHLRDNNLVHRDLKPGNILKFISDDGCSVYKLTDFGAARELHEGEEFISLYGTEEYLHPDMYEQALLRKFPGMTFGATVDLWSIGVTLYHIATGNFPFRPYGGRKNKETMYLITKKKETGVISGMQTEYKGPIYWNRNLPINCQLSVGLKKIVTPLLAGLLEADQKLIWSFEKFFNEVTKILSKKRINIFYINQVKSIKIYIEPDERFEHLQSYIKEQTQIECDHQILLYKENLFLDIVGADLIASEYLYEDESLILISKENNNVSIISMPDDLKFPEFPKLLSVQNDADLAKTACIIGHVCKRRIESMTQAMKLINYSVNYFTNYIRNQLKLLESKCLHLKEITLNHKLTSQTIYLTKTTINTLTNNENKLTDISDELNIISFKFLNETNPKVKQLYQKYVVENRLELEWKFSKTIQYQVKSPAKAKTLIEQLCDSWKHLVSDCEKNTLSYNDQQFHILKRIKIKEINRQIKQLLQAECRPAYNRLAETLSDWYKTAQTIYLQAMILDNDVLNYESTLNLFSQNLSVFSLQYFDEMQAILDETKNVNVVTNNKKLNKKLKNIFKEAEKDELKTNLLIDENAKFLQTLTHFINTKIETVGDTE